MEKRVLVIDDEPAVCDVLQRFLTKKGYIATTALSGEEGIKRIVMEEKPNVVLLDVRMPGMDGVETLQKILEIDKDITVIMVTAVKEDEVARKCMKLGAYHYIVKPFSIDYLETVLMSKLHDTGK